MLDGGKSCLASSRARCWLMKVLAKSKAGIVARSDPMPLTNERNARPDGVVSSSSSSKEAKTAAVSGNSAAMPRAKGETVRPSAGRSIGRGSGELSPRHTAGAGREGRPIASEPCRLLILTHHHVVQGSRSRSIGRRQARQLSRRLRPAACRAVGSRHHAPMSRVRRSQRGAWKRRVS